MQSEFNRGASFCRDCIISNIIGMQNDIGNDEKDSRYMILQELLIHIENEYGKPCTSFKA